MITGNYWNARDTEMTKTDTPSWNTRSRLSLLWNMCLYGLLYVGGVNHFLGGISFSILKLFSLEIINNLLTGHHYGVTIHQKLQIPFLRHSKTQSPV